MDIREINCENGRWLEPDQSRVKWRALVLFLLGRRFECYIMSYINLLNLYI
jgi:hypothetical protein